MSKPGKPLKRSSSNSSRLSKQVSNAVSVAENNYDDLPVITDEKWVEMISNQEEDKALYGIEYEIYKKSRDAEKNEYIKLHVYPFIVMCAHIAWTKIINIYFQRCDPGESSEQYDKVWKADEEPSPSPADSWASHCIPVLEEPIPTEDLKPSTAPYPKRKQIHIVDKKEFVEDEEVSRAEKEILNQEGKLQVLGEEKKDETDILLAESDETVTDEKQEPLTEAKVNLTQEEIRDGAKILYNAKILGTAKEISKHDEKPQDILKKDIAATNKATKKYVLITELDEDMRQLLKILFGKTEYTRIMNENVPVPKDLIDTAIESLPKIVETDDITTEVIKYCDDFDEEDEFGFCFTEEEEFSVDDILSEPYKSKPDNGDPYKGLKLYQKYENDPVILDKR